MTDCESEILLWKLLRFDPRICDLFIFYVTKEVIMRLYIANEKIIADN